MRIRKKFNEGSWMVLSVDNTTGVADPMQILYSAKYERVARRWLEKHQDQLPVVPNSTWTVVFGSQGQ